MAKPEAAKLESPTTKEVKSLKMTDLQLFDYGNASWRVVAPKNLTPEDLENPILWNVVSAKLKAFDQVTALAANARWWAELLVVASEKGFAPVLKVLRVVEFPELPSNKHNDLPAGFRIDFDATTSSYQAFREKDGVAMTPPLPRREDVRSQLVNHASLR